MEREGKGGEGEAEKQENLGEKLRRGALVGKRCGPTTPVVSSWTLFSLPHSHPITTPKRASASASASAFANPSASASAPAVSVRRLGAALWELQGYLLPFAKMHRGGAQANGAGAGAANGGPPPPRLRHLSNHNHRHHKDKGVLDLSHFLADNNSLTSDPDQVGVYTMDHLFFFFFLYLFVLHF